MFTPGPPLGANKANFPDAGISFRAPGGWSQVKGTAPAVATIATGRAVIGVFRYPRPDAALPRTQAQLDAAGTALVAAARARDASFTPTKIAKIKVNGHPAIQVRGTETVDGQQRMVRSTHIYAEGAEIVIDAFAPLQDFKRVDAQVFRPMLRTVTIVSPTPAAA